MGDLPPRFGFKESANMSAMNPSAAATLDTQSAQAVPLAQDAKVMGLVGLAHASSHFGHMLLPPLFPVFMKEFDLSFAQVGLLMTVFFVVSGIGQALAGFVVDKLGARPVLFGALGTFIAACLVASNAQGYGWLVAAAALAGLANCPFHPIDFSILNQRVSSPRLGYAFSVHGLSGSLGWALTPILLVGLMGVIGWRNAYLVTAAVYAAVLATLLINREHMATTVVRKSAAGTPDSSLDFLKLPVVWWCFAFFLLSTITLAVVQSYSASILKAMHGVSLQAATATLTAYMLASALGILLGGFVSARMGAQRSDRVVAVCMSVGAMCMMLAGTGWLGAFGSMALLALTGLAVGIGGPSRDMLIKRATPKGATGRVYGTVYSGLDVGFAVAPLIFGLLMDRALYSLTMITSAFALILAVFAALAVGRRTAAH
jgi:MFS transporter, FSR family, fosmidomycin resistance protein